MHAIEFHNIYKGYILLGLDVSKKEVTLSILARVSCRVMIPEGERGMAGGQGSGDCVAQLRMRREKGK